MTNEELRLIENASIRNFVQKNLRFLKGDVLDCGCGKGPYRGVIEAVGSHYYGYDRKEFPANVSGEDIGSMEQYYDAILCTQVVQYVWNVETLLYDFYERLVNRRGYLVLTYPTTWPVVESEDYWRFTQKGMEYLLWATEGFEIVSHEVRAEIDVGEFSLPLGGGIVAQAS